MDKELGNVVRGVDEVSNAPKLDPADPHWKRRLKGEDSMTEDSFDRAREAFFGKGALPSPDKSADWGLTRFPRSR